MDKPNKERILVQILKELSQEMNFTINFLCYNWLIKIQKDGICKHIMGYSWGINNATAELIAKDKSACCELLLAQKVPTVEHQLFLSPQFQNYIGKNGSWKALLQYAEKYNFNIVCKSNLGTGGNAVFKITNQLELETAVHKLFTKTRGICLSPFYDIKVEYRVIVLNGESQLIYAKQKPRIIGDGKSPIFKLIKELDKPIDTTEIDPTLDLSNILPKGEILVLSWKHNLGKGAKPMIIEEEGLKERLSQLALVAVKAIDINFASVDIIECVDGGWRVLEINAGIMTENFAKESGTNYDIAKEIYKQAIMVMMG